MVGTKIFAPGGNNDGATAPLSYKTSFLTTLAIFSAVLMACRPPHAESTRDPQVRADRDARIGVESMPNNALVRLRVRGVPDEYPNLVHVRVESDVGEIWYDGEVDPLVDLELTVRRGRYRISVDEHICDPGSGSDASPSTRQCPKIERNPLRRTFWVRTSVEEPTELVVTPRGSALMPDLYVNRDPYRAQGKRERQHLALVVEYRGDAADDAGDAQRTQGSSPSNQLTPAQRDAWWVQLNTGGTDDSSEVVMSWILPPAVTRTTFWIPETLARAPVIVQRATLVDARHAMGLSCDGKGAALTAYAAENGWGDDPIDASQASAMYCDSIRDRARHVCRASIEFDDERAATLAQPVGSQGCEVTPGRGRTGRGRSGG